MVIKVIMVEVMTMVVKVMGIGEVVQMPMYTT